MKHLIQIFILFLILRCSSYQNYIFSGYKYINKENPYTYGHSIIEFSDSTFQYTKNNYIRYGKWKMSSNGKFLILEENYFIEMQHEDSIFIEKLNTSIQFIKKDRFSKQTINKRFKIKNEETLVDESGYVYNREK